MYHGILRHLDKGLVGVEVLIAFGYGDVVCVGFVLYEDRMVEGVFIIIVSDIGNGYGINCEINIGHTYLPFTEDILDGLRQQRTRLYY